MRAIGHTFIAVFLFSRNTHLAPASAGGQNQRAALQRGAIGQTHFVVATLTGRRDQFFSALQVHDVYIIFLDVLLHGRHQLGTLGVGHRDQVLDAHGVRHLATEAFCGDTGRDTLARRIDSG